VVRVDRALGPHTRRGEGAHPVRTAALSGSLGSTPPEGPCLIEGSPRLAVSVPSFVAPTALNETLDGGRDRAEEGTDRVRDVVGSLHLELGRTAGQVDFRAVVGPPRAGTGVLLGDGPLAVPSMYSTGQSIADVRSRPN